MNFLFRRSSSIASSASRSALAALLAAEPPLVASATTAAARRSSLVHRLATSGKFGSCGRREIHFSPGPLGFNATDAVSAQCAAVDEYYEDESGASASATAKQAGGGGDGLEVASLGISQDIVSKLASRGIAKLFPIQRAVLEPAMQGRDMIGRARTGTGKTLAFGIPIMDNIVRFQAKHGRGRNPLAMVLAPTRELARQVEKEFAESCSLDTLCVYGGTPISQQMKALNYGVDVVVGTPGRIIDLLNRGALNLSEIQFVVLDEADQMLAVGFAEDVEKILEKLLPNRQSMMFSATMPSWIRSLTRKFLKDPVTIDLVGDSDQKLADGITLYSIATDNYAKPSILGPLIKEHAKGGKCIIFTQTKRDADRLAYAMGRSFGCEALHGDISQNQRERTLAGFRDGRFNILIATDVAARGLDIPNVDLVIHYELPNTSEIFVHRSGRTGRAGKKGSAILIHTNEQNRLVRGIEQDVGCKFVELPRITVEGGAEDMFGGMNTNSRFDSYGRGQGFNRGGNFGGSNFGRSRGFEGSSSFRSSSGASGNYGEPRPGRFGSFGASDSGSGSSSFFGRSGSSGSGGFGDTGSGHFSNLRDSNSSRFRSFGDSDSSNFGSPGSSRFGSPSGSGGFGNSSSSNFASGGNSFGHFPEGSGKNNSY